MTYGTVSGARDYATARGLSLPVDDADVSELLQRANDLLEAKRYQGMKTDLDQALQWPRTGVWLDGKTLDSDTVPQQVINAEYQFAVELQTQDFAAVQTGDDLIELTVPGAITQRWSSGRGLPTSTAVNNWLRGLTINRGFAQRV